MELLRKLLGYSMTYLILFLVPYYGVRRNRLYSYNSPTWFYTLSYIIEWVVTGIAVAQNNIFIILILLFCPIIVVRFLQMEKNNQYPLYGIRIEYLRKVSTDILFTLGGICGILGSSNFLSNSIISFIGDLEIHGFINNVKNIENDFYIFVIMLGINRVIDLILYDYRQFEHRMNDGN